MGITRRRQRGQVLIIFPIAAIGMLSVIGLLYSFGVILNGRRTLQTAADAASLSGSWHVLQQVASGARSDDSVRVTVADFATTVNGVSSDVLEAFYLDSAGQPAQLVGGCPVLVGSGGQFPVNARGVQVAITRQVPTILPAFVNVLQMRVRATAAAAARASTLIAVLIQETVNPCGAP